MSTFSYKYAKLYTMLASFSVLQHVPCLHACDISNSPRFQRATANIISFDGGGMRGVIEATICAEIEKKVGPLGDKFNMFAGASTGGIVAAGLSVQEDGKYKYSACDLKDLYIEKGREIFTTTWRGYLLGNFNVFGPTYSSYKKQEIFQNLMGNAKLSDLSNDLIIPYYDLQNSGQKFFKTTSAKFMSPTKEAVVNLAHDYYLADALMSTTAAPTYFDSYNLQSIHQKEFGLEGIPTADGGIFANDPSLNALTEAARTYNFADSFLLVSVGTGEFRRNSLDFSNLLSAGLSLGDIVVNGPADASKYILENMGVMYNVPINYYRLDINIPIAHSKMDDCSTGNIRFLINAVENNEKLHAKIDDMCENFLARRKLPSSIKLPKSVKGKLHSNFYKR